MDYTNSNGGSENRRKKKKKRFSFLKLIGWIFLSIFTIGVIGVFTTYLFLQVFLTYINTSIVPTVDVTVEELTMREASTIYYQDNATGEWKVLDTLFAAEGNRKIVEYEDLPQHLIDAVVAIEDHRFWTHPGVDWEGTAAAVVKTFTTGSTRGGSTITQQLLRNVTKDNDVTVKRKIREIIRALEFEKKHSKEDILTLYLNYVYFGSGCDGIQTAAEKYFGKDVSELTLAESACIIGITNNPSLYDPFRKAEFVQEDGSIKTPRDFNKARQETILDRMAHEDIGYITKAEAEAAKKEFLMFTDTPEYAALHAGDDNGDDANTSNVYTWFTDVVIADAAQLIAEAKSCDLSLAYDLLYSAGYHIYTTLDMDIQRIVDSVYEDPSNFDYPSSKGTPLDSAITITDPYTGDVVAIAGGVGEKTVSRALNLATSPRPCGSAIKPVSVYAPAIDQDVISPGSIIDDYPIHLNDSNSGGWPKNSNNKYRGYTTVSYAVQWSLNTIATRVLDLLGTENAFYFMEDNLGFDLDVNDNALAPLSMGGLTYGVTTEEMAAAFASFANSGIYNKPHTVIQILGNDGKEVIADNPVDSRIAMKETTAYLMNTMLRSVVTGGTGTSAAFDGMTIAGKTGTTSNNFDRYFVGYTPYYSAAVWVGYSQSNEKINSGTKNPAALAWKMIMEKVHAGLENKSFPEKPAGIVRKTVCQDCGLLAGELCSSDVRGNRTITMDMQESAVPTEECTCHTTITVCTYPETGEVHLAGAFCPEETCSTQVILTGREFLEIPYETPITNEDGTITTGNPILSTDSDYHLTYRQTLPTCPYHDENFEPVPPEDEPLLPGDEGWEWPDWWPWGEPENPEDSPVQPNVPENPISGTTPPGEAGQSNENAAGGTVSTPTEPVEPTEPSTPSEPKFPFTNLFRPS